MGQALSLADREALDRLRASLYGWHFCDLKKAATAEVDLPRLAFIGLASWIDTVARLLAGGKLKDFDAWEAFIHAYMPARYHPKREVRRLYDGLRNAISHEYGTRGVLLTHAKPQLHWTAVSGDLRFLDLHALLDEFEAAFDRFYRDLEADADLRARVLPRAQGLLAPVEVAVQKLPQVEPAIAASATAPVLTVVRDPDSGR